MDQKRAAGSRATCPLPRPADPANAIARSPRSPAMRPVCNIYVVKGAIVSAEYVDGT